MTLKESQAACRKLTRATARNFGMTFRVLPADQSRDMETLYAFMRRTDDIADQDAVGEQRRQQLLEWRDAFRSAVSGAPSENAYLPAVGELVRRRKLKPAHFEAVIEGCVQDTNAVAIRTREDLEDYCYHVAGAVGLCCIGIWGYAGQQLPGSDADRERAEQLAIKTGFAFQLTNIIRDIREDSLLGRRYLPADDLRKHQCDDELLAATPPGPPTGAVRALLAYEVGVAQEAYAESAELLRLLSPAGRRILASMRGVYGGILDEIERRDYDVFTERVRLSRLRKAVVLWRGWTA